MVSDYDVFNIVYNTDVIAPVGKPLIQMQKNFFTGYPYISKLNIKAISADLVVVVGVTFPVYITLVDSNKNIVLSQFPVNDLSYQTVIPGQRRLRYFNLKNIDLLNSYWQLRGAFGTPTADIRFCSIRFYA